MEALLAVSVAALTLYTDAERYDNAINSLTELKVEVGTDKEPYSLDLTVSDEDRNGVRDILSPSEDGKTWLEKRWVLEDGTVDMEKLSSDIYKLANHDKNVAIAFTQGKSAGAKASVKDINNIDFENGQPSSDSNTDGLSEAARMAIEANS
jgi:hypothetical protein